MFTITKEQDDKINKWLSETVYPPILERQRADKDFQVFVLKDKEGKEYPYFGAIGGELTYSFTPTSLGVITKVTHAMGAELDLTDYSIW